MKDPMREELMDEVKGHGQSGLLHISIQRCQGSSGWPTQAAAYNTRPSQTMPLQLHD